MEKEHPLMPKPNWRWCQYPPLWWTKNSSDSVCLGFQKNSTVPSGTSPNTAIWCILCEILTLDITILWAVSPENGVHLCLWGWLVFIPVSKKECCDLPPKTLISHWLGLSCGSWSQFIPIIPMLPSVVSFSTVCLSWNSASPPAPGREDRMGHGYSVYRCSKVLHNTVVFVVVVQSALFLSITLTVWTPSEVKLSSDMNQVLLFGWRVH